LSDTDDVRQVDRLRHLGSMGSVPVGTQVFVHEDGIVYIGVGTTTPKIAERIGWDQENIWMPEHVLQYVQLRHAPVVDPVTTAAFVLRHPMSVHQDRGSRHLTYFLVDAAVIREQGFLQSSSSRFVDAIVELRYVPGGSILRLFHLSPRNRNQGGMQLWP
jgi:hypothetical protein